jgi:hypothetical protein
VAGIGCLSGGDTLIVHAGTYAENFDGVIPSGPGFRLVQVSATGTLTLEALTLTGGLPDGDGGAIRSAGLLTMSDVIMTSNAATDGGALASSGTTTIQRSRLTNNAARIVGGAIFVSGGTLTLDRSTVSNNLAQGPGAGLANGFFMAPSGQHVQITNSAFVQNRSDMAGALYNTGMLDLTSTTFAFNQVLMRQVGEATVLQNSGGTATLQHCTVSGNASIFPLSGAIPAVRNSAGVVTLENTILSLNADGAVPGGQCAGVLTSLGGNIVGDLTGCTLPMQPDDVTSDPLLDNLVDDGTPGNAHWPLIAGSPAIDAAHAVGCPATDQLGNARIGACDIGAVEFQPPPQQLVAQRVAKVKKPKR